MSRLTKKIIIKTISALLIFIVFVYLTVVICSIPGDFTMAFSKGKFISTYSVQEITDMANKNIKSILSGNFSYSLRGKNQVDILKEKMLKTLSLLTGGILLGVFIGIIKGVFDSRKEKSKESYGKVLLTIIPISIPDLLVIALLQYLAIVLNKNGITIFKVAGQGTINHMLLPIIALSILPASYIARVTAMSIENCYEMEYVKTARGKGCSKRRILWNHVMRNALGIAFEGLSNITALIICNLLIVEYMFSYRGLVSSLADFFRLRDMNGVTTIIIMIGLVYFILDNLFQFAKKITFSSLSEESI